MSEMHDVLKHLLGNIIVRRFACNTTVSTTFQQKLCDEGKILAPMLCVNKIKPLKSRYCLYNEINLFEYILDLNVIQEKIGSIT